MNAKANVNDLIKGVMPVIVAKRYSESYIKGFRATFDRLSNYCLDHGHESFSAEIAERFMRDCYRVRPGVVDKRSSRLHRAMDLLSDYQHFGTVMIRRRLNRTFPSGLRGPTETYLKDMKLRGRRDNTVLSHKGMLLRFADFLDSISVSEYGALTSDATSQFIKVVMCNYSRSVSVEYSRILRRFLGWLFKSGFTKEDLSAKLIPVKSISSQTRIPTTFTDEQIQGILSAVDRESPQGKRDYAILLIATKLGVRTSDIRSLRPSDFDWDRHLVSFTQVKTGEPLSLPLPADVGWAVIDYLKNGRPVTDAPEMFVHAVAPYEHLSGLDGIIVKYMRKAGIRLDVVKHHGLHALRHSLATHMLDENVPLASIQSVLGHVNAETTLKYLGVSVQQLRSCALEVID